MCAKRSFVTGPVGPEARGRGQSFRDKGHHPAGGKKFTRPSEQGEWLPRGQGEKEKSVGGPAVRRTRLWKKTNPSERWNGKSDMCSWNGRS